MQHANSGRNANFKMRNSNNERVRNNGVNVVTTFTPVLQTILCLHLAFCILNYRKRRRDIHPAIANKELFEFCILNFAF
jgi:hypothetical protein